MGGWGWEGTDHSDGLHIPKHQGQETLPCEGHLGGLTISHVNVLALGLEFIPELRLSRQTGAGGSVTTDEEVWDGTDGGRAYAGERSMTISFTKRYHKRLEAELCPGAQGRQRPPPPLPGLQMIPTSRLLTTSCRLYAGIQKKTLRPLSTVVQGIPPQGFLSMTIPDIPKPVPEPIQIVRFSSPHVVSHS